MENLICNDRFRTSVFPKRDAKLYWNFLFGCLFALLPAITTAHAPDQSYTFLRVYDTSVGGYFEIAVKDINTILGLDLPPDLDMETLKPYLTRVKEYYTDKVAFRSGTSHYPVRFLETEVVDRESLGRYIDLHFVLEDLPEVPDHLTVRNEVGLEKGSVHRGYLVVEYNWKAGVHNNESFVSLSFTPDQPEDSLSLTDASLFKGFIAMIKSGMHHIFIGLDHILFLLALLLPSVVRRKPRKETVVPEYANKFASGATLAMFSEPAWVPVSRFKPAFLYVIKVITLFTVAHTITLSLAALHIVILPSRIVETIIALSIGLAALHNIRPLFSYSDWVIVFGFGLFHGFGFASVLADIGLSGEFMTLTLLGFNLGVEVGQVLIISLIFPLLYLIRKLRIYPHILVFGSFMLIIISLNWVIERFFEVDMPLSHYIDMIFSKIIS